MRALDAQVELVPAEFQVPFAECFHMYFTGVGGARVHAKLVRPKNAKTPHPAVLMFHGYTGDSGDLSDKLAYVAPGYTVAALDCRGQGGLSEDPGGVARQHPARAHHPRPGRCPQRSARETTLPPDLPRHRPDGQDRDGNARCRSAPGGRHRRQPGRRADCGLHRPGAADQTGRAGLPLPERLQARLGDGPGQGCVFRIERILPPLRPRHEKEDAIFEKLGYIDIQFLAPRIRAEVLWAIGLMDTICPPSSQFAAYNKITCQKALLIYPDFGHEGLPELNDKIYNFMMGL